MVVRNFLYQTGVFASKEYDLPVIGVGNLRVGGTGKTPMIEYLITLLIKERRLAVLSRGYGRKTSGYFLATDKSTAAELGDEPAQIKSKFPNVQVAVDGDRVNGIRRLQTEYPEINAILLDDVYQHRAVKPGLLILLTAYGDLYVDDLVLPAGRLREPKASAIRADLIVVTKCPQKLNAFERRSILERINARSHQQVFFTSEKYGEIYSLADRSKLIPQSVENIILLTGIAKASTVVEYLDDRYSIVEHLQFGDHHWYSEKDIHRLNECLTKANQANTVIVTTEKDAQRLSTIAQIETFAALPIFVLPMKVDFLGEESGAFNSCIHEFIRSYQ